MTQRCCTVSALHSSVRLRNTLEDTILCKEKQARVLTSQKQTIQVLAGSQASVDNIQTTKNREKINNSNKEQ